jgi:hypothetical protein
MNNPKTNPKRTLVRLPGVALKGNHIVKRKEQSLDAALKIEIDDQNHPRQVVVSSVGGSVTTRLDEHGILQIVVAGRGHEVQMAVTPQGSMGDPIVRKRRGRIWLPPGYLEKYK